MADMGLMDMPFQPPMPDPRMSGRINAGNVNPQEPAHPPGVMEAIQLLASVAPWALASGAAVGGIAATRAAMRAAPTYGYARATGASPMGAAGAVGRDIAGAAGLGAANGAISGGVVGDALGAWQRNGRMDDQMPPMPQYPPNARGLMP